MDNIKSLEDKIDNLQASLDAFIKIYLAAYPLEGSGQDLLALYKRHKQTLLTELHNKEKK